MKGIPGIFISAFGHAGDGNLHVNLLYEEGKEEIAKALREKILKKVLQLCGTISGEHGVGYTKRPYVIWELDPLQIEIMKKIKKVFDPKGILNPPDKASRLIFKFFPLFQSVGGSLLFEVGYSRISRTAFIVSGLTVICLKTLSPASFIASFQKVSLSKSLLS